MNEYKSSLPVEPGQLLGQSKKNETNKKIKDEKFQQTDLAPNQD